MSLLLAGLTVLVIGDSHMTQDYLISALHDELMQQGARVYSYGACGASAGDWMRTMRPGCGSAFRLDKGPIRNRVAEAGSTRPLPEMVKEYHPDLIVVVNGDDMAGYKAAMMPKNWAWNQITSLTAGIKSSGASCMWVGPPWGEESGVFGKTFTRVKEMSDYLAEIVSPCIYINSLKMAKPGEWKTHDGVHLTAAGYQVWGSLITKEIVSADILKKIK
ncbi:MAG: SGNH/GDSL hydrolase family protein [Proteobacteria bacterium]|nr:SGNH/GDSL hydrolase family protein [Pseudomonadota bacterium]